MDPRQNHERAVTTAARFREMNEKIRHGVDAFDGGVGPYLLMCECPLDDCQDMLELGREAYEHVRSDPTWFVVLPEHVVTAAQRVLDRLDSHWIVRNVDDDSQPADADS